MKRHGPYSDQLSAAVGDVLRLLETLDMPARSEQSGAESLSHLIAEGRALRDSADTNAEPLRSLHHMACSGGTVIARCLAVQPNVILLSEVDPLSMHGIPRTKPEFAPTDFIRHLRTSIRSIPAEVIGQIFLAGLKPLMEHCNARGAHLVLRDHAHSHFCHGTDVLERPSLRELLLRAYPVRSIVTVRHPLDNFLSLSKNGWLHFQPPTLTEFCRRYLMFLDAYEGVEVFRYEDFVANPEAALHAMCSALELPFSEFWPGLIKLTRLTGNSGRVSDSIAARPRRRVPVAIAREAERSDTCIELCERLGY